MTTVEIVQQISKVINERIRQSNGGRTDAMADFLSLSLPHLDEARAQRLGELIPALPQKLYDKWVGMFTARLLETIPHNQLEELCSGSAENDATLAMVYILFMESERMEQEVAKDFAEFGFEATNGTDASSGLAAYLKAQMEKFQAEIAPNSCAKQL